MYSTICREHRIPLNTAQFTLSGLLHFLITLWWQAPNEALGIEAIEEKPDPANFLPKTSKVDPERLVSPVAKKKFAANEGNISSHQC